MTELPLLLRMARVLTWGTEFSAIPPPSVSTDPATNGTLRE